MRDAVFMSIALKVDGQRPKTVYMAKRRQQMEGQISLLDMPQTKPDYHGATDEITRYSIELDFENKINLQQCPCCGEKPQEYFKSCHDYFVRCDHCGKKTKMFRHAYEAKQAWNRGEKE